MTNGNDSSYVPLSLWGGGSYTAETDLYSVHTQTVQPSNDASNTPMTELRPHEGEDGTSNLLARTIRNLGEGLTGIAASEKKDWYLSIGYLLQRVRSGRFLETLKTEWDRYRDKGRIKDDYLDTEQHQECLQEVLDFLDQDSPDHIRFAALKQVFLNSATECLSSRDSVLPQQYIRICRKLNSGEVLLLQATYQLSQSGDSLNDLGAIGWIKKLAEASPLRHKELVELHERTLMEKRLLGPRRYSDRSGIEETEHFRLTDLGYELCRFMREHDIENDA